MALRRFSCAYLVIAASSSWVKALGSATTLAGFLRSMNCSGAGSLLLMAIQFRDTFPVHLILSSLVTLFIITSRALPTVCNSGGLKTEYSQQTFRFMAENLNTIGRQLLPGSNLTSCSLEQDAPAASGGAAGDAAGSLCFPLAVTIHVGRMKEIYLNSFYYYDMEVDHDACPPITTATNSFQRRLHHCITC